MNMMRWLPPTLAALLLIGCGKGTDTQAPASTDVGEAMTDGDVAPEAHRLADGDTDVTTPEADAPGPMLMPPDWFPKDWDPNAYRGAEPGTHAELRHSLRQELMLRAPLLLWSVANDKSIDERYEPIWVLWAALRSCERGIQMNEDLAGEFGDRARGKAALTTTRNELMAFAATQPKDITLSFTANLGQWDAQTGRFNLRDTGSAYNINALEVEKRAESGFNSGASVSLYHGADGQAISELFFHATSLQCVAADGQSWYTFDPLRNWQLLIGDIAVVMGGLIQYKSYTYLPAIAMDRDQAAAFATRNAERKVLVTITLGPDERPLPISANLSRQRAVMRKAEITDALDGSVLAAQVY